MKKIKTFEDLFDAIKKLYTNAIYNYEDFIGKEIIINEINIKIVKSYKTSIVLYNIIHLTKNKDGVNFINDITSLSKVYDIIKEMYENLNKPDTCSSCGEEYVMGQKCCNGEWV